MRSGGPLGRAGLALLLMAAAAPGEQPRPSVVLVACDSMDGRLTFYPGNQTVDLPFINFMKRHGTVFLNAYTNSPICCPSRAAMCELPNLFANLTEASTFFKNLQDL